MAISIFKDAVNNQSKPISSRHEGMLEKIGGVIWFLVSFILFVVLGPFSAPIALIALLQLGCEESDRVSPEPVG
ncbi:MAG: hypothetical protein ACI8ZB_001931 [Desulforhopalus sp.]|jgi:hypothetical protein